MMSEPKTCCGASEYNSREKQWYYQGYWVIFCPFCGARLLPNGDFEPRGEVGKYEDYCEARIAEVEAKAKRLERILFGARYAVDCGLGTEQAFAEIAEAMGWPGYETRKEAAERSDDE